MRAIIQRVSQASVRIDGMGTAAIGRGLLVLIAFEERDTPDDVDWMTGKLVRLRVFDDQNGLMNLSIQDVQGDFLVVSQFTLYASTKKGNRPSYIRSAKPDVAVPLYESFVGQLAKEFGKPVFTGQFGADMKVELVNDGPVTIPIDSRSRE